MGRGRGRVTAPGVTVAVGDHPGCLAQGRGVRARI